MEHYGIINNKGEWHSDKLTEDLKKLGFKEATEEEWASNGMHAVQGISAADNHTAIVSELNSTKESLNEVTVNYNALQAQWDNVDAVKARYDELGKLVQTLTGEGTAFDPYKGWTLGMTVEANKWYYVPDPSDPDNPYLWMAIKDGTPTSATDSEYFDIVS